MILSCPSKTFLLGEYLALKGLPCLLAATEPRFQLKIERGAGRSPFHPDSPAGRLWSRNFDQTREWTATFTNPLPIGGLGASSAEFLLLQSALQVKGHIAWEAQLEPDLSEILKAYSEVNQGKAVKPSGADLVSQLKGGVTFFERGRGKIERRPWGFTDLSFLLFSTGVKVPTHEHLAGLGQWNETALLAAVEVGAQAWLSQDSRGFVESVRQTRAELKNLRFEAESTTKILEALFEDPAVKAAKGCGALGADVVLVLTAPDKKDELKTRLSKKLSFLACEQNVSEGLLVNPQSVAESGVRA